MTNLINLTPHAIRIRVEENNIAEPLESDIVIQSSGVAARVSSKSIVVGEIDGIPVKKTEFGHIDNLPDPEDGVVYIVSMIVAQAAKTRSDVVGPNTGPGQDIRYPEGHPQKGLTFAVRGFQQF